MPNSGPCDKTEEKLEAGLMEKKSQFPLFASKMVIPRNQRENEKLVGLIRIDANLFESWGWIKDKVSDFSVM